MKGLTPPRRVPWNRDADPTLGAIARRPSFFRRAISRISNRDGGMATEIPVDTDLAERGDEVWSPSKMGCSSAASRGTRRASSAGRSSGAVDARSWERSFGRCHIPAGPWKPGRRRRPSRTGTTRGWLDLERGRRLYRCASGRWMTTAFRSGLARRLTLDHCHGL